MTPFVSLITKFVAFDEKAIYALSELIDAFELTSFGVVPRLSLLICSVCAEANE